MFEFFIALFGGIYLFLKHLRGKSVAAAKKAEREETDRKFDCAHRKYGATPEFNREIDGLTRTNIAALRERVEDSYDVIMSANPYLKSIDIDKRYLRNLVYAKSGYVDSINYEYDLSGDKYTIAEKIAFAREVERMLIEAGHEDACFVYCPGIGVDLYDDSKLYMGRLILKEFNDAFGFHNRTRRLW